jgi:hypothetical protein
MWVRNLQKVLAMQLKPLMQACMRAVCNSAGTQVSINAAGQVTKVQTTAPAPTAPKNNVTGNTPVRPCLP